MNKNKQYEKPLFTIVELSNEDVIMVSINSMSYDFAIDDFFSDADKILPL